MSGKPKSREYMQKDMYKDRHSAGVKVKTKKGGKGKYSWGKPGIDDLNYELDDFHDEFVEDYDREDFFLEVTEVMDPVKTILGEFFQGADFDDCNDAITEAIEVEGRPRFVKKAIHAAMDQRAYERELTSRLFCIVAGNSITRDQLAHGFELTLDELPDTLLDVPKGVEIVAKFIARAELDEVLAPKFLTQTEASNPKAKECLELAKGMLTAPHFGPRLTHIWGPGDLCSVKRMIQECRYLVGEYLNTKDREEAIASIRRLGAESFHPRFVREAIRIALERDDDSYKRVFELISIFVKADIISQYSVGRGFQLVLARQKDMKLDFPKIDERLPVYISFAREQKLLPPEKATANQ
mmetsp:Transcript_2360/g.6590  ORF Transcript_2360/g.6590 Transcript_2360/m.6590 type:complete len:354 (-) Transcript_2360:25-1086(-)